MSARTARKAKERKRKPMASDASLRINTLYSSRETACEVRLGPPGREVDAKVEITVCDPDERGDTVDTVLVNWTINRWLIVDNKDGEATLTRDDVHDETSFRLHEIEAWSVALSKAVQLAKKQGYLPAGSAQ
jgi:hypothetical protein